MKCLFTPCCVLFACPHNASPTANGEEGGPAPWFWGKSISDRHGVLWEEEENECWILSAIPLAHVLLFGEVCTGWQVCCWMLHTLLPKPKHCSCTSSDRNAGPDWARQTHLSLLGMTFWCLPSDMLFRYFKFWYTFMNYLQEFVKVLAEEEEYTTTNRNKSRISRLNWWNLSCNYTTRSAQYAKEVFAWNILL